MKRKIFYGAAFWAGLLLCALALSALVYPKTLEAEPGYDLTLASAYRAESENTVDVVFFGDSEVYHGISPTLLWRDHGIASVLCATNSQEVFETAYFFRQVLKNQSPKVVVFQVNELFVESEPGQVVKSELEPFLPVLRYHDRWKELSRDDLRLNSRGLVPVDRKGFYYSEENVPAKAVVPMEISEEAAELPFLNRKYYEHMLSLCERRGIKAVFLATPSAACWAGEYSNGAAELAKQMGVDFLEMNLMQTEIPIDWSEDTTDGGFHLNAQGAEKVTGFLGKYLSGTGLLTDHRGDPAYASWQEALDRLAEMGEF